MSDAVAELTARARLLAPEEREQLVDGLLALINEPATTELDASWEAEIQRRLTAYDRGEVEAIDAEEVFAKARRIAQ